ncbi:hypothetical protein AB6A40_003856 [Gnathostoma spinigerum]|uniref:Uncharacterized protein n=1 Tax=Gnathostoma spinigerum TaxID=75299 RepID=A0ABD6EKB8_9BILA
MRLTVLSRVHSCLSLLASAEYAATIESLPFLAHSDVSKFSKQVCFDDIEKVPVVELRVPLNDFTWPSSSLKKRFEEKYAHRIDREGNLVVESRRTRTEQLNYADCLDKLRTAIIKCHEDLVSETIAEQPCERLRAKTEAARMLQKYRMS